MNYLGLLDMIDGGGAGRAGQKFEGGGLLSDIGNALFKPHGYRDRMAAVRPQARPAMPAAMGSQSPTQPAVDIHDVPPPLTYGPQNGRRPAPQFNYGPQNGRPVVGPTNNALLQQALAEMSNPNTPPERRAQIEQTLRAMPGLQGGGDILGYLGGI